MCVGAIAGPDHPVWKLQLLQPADPGFVSFSTGRPACQLLAPQATDNQRYWFLPDTHASLVTFTLTSLCLVLRSRSSLLGYRAVFPNLFSLINPNSPISMALVTLQPNMFPFKLK